MPAYDLNGKVALVTGAARGIGFETARQIQLRGASVALVDLDAAETEVAARRIGRRTIAIAADVSDREQIEAAVARTVEQFGGLDVAVANAGIAPELGSTRATAPEEWERVINVNLLGVYRTVRAAMPQVIGRRGHLVLVASVYAFVNGVMVSSYATAKAGVESLGRSLRAELSPYGAGTSVAYFGFIDTRMVQEGFSHPLAERLEEELLPVIGRRRLHPADAGRAIVEGVEERRPRIAAPSWWRVVQTLRGILNPVLDRQMASNEKFAAIVREGDAMAAAERQAESAPADAAGTETQSPA
jgi:NAD(P)-dependent dehydrogenase (short-subunit alcohol dehydrogenase family)